MPVEINQLHDNWDSLTPRDRCGILNNELAAKKDSDQRLPNWMEMSLEDLSVFKSSFYREFQGIYSTASLEDVLEAVRADQSTDGLVNRKLLELATLEFLERHQEFVDKNPDSSLFDNEELGAIDKYFGQQIEANNLTDEDYESWYKEIKDEARYAQDLQGVYEESETDVSNVNRVLSDLKNQMAKGKREFANISIERARRALEGRRAEIATKVLNQMSREGDSGRKGKFIDELVRFSETGAELGIEVPNIEVLKQLGMEGRSTADMYDYDPQVEIPKARANPGLYHVEKMLRMWNYGRSAVGERLRWESVKDMEMWDYRQEKVADAMFHLEQIAHGLVTSMDTKRVLAQIEALTLKEMVAFQKFEAPIRIEKENGEVMESAISMAKAMDIFERDPELRSRFYSPNPDIHEEAADKWTVLLAQSIVGEDPMVEGFDPSKMKISIAGSQEDLTDESKRREYTDAQGNKVETLKQFLNLFKFATKGATNYNVTFGEGTRYIRQATKEDIPYIFRSWLLAGAYNNVSYAIGTPHSRPAKKPHYHSHTSEVVYGIEPVLNPKIKLDYAQGLVDINGRELREKESQEKIELRERVAEWVKVSKPLRPWLEYYQDCIARGETVTIPPDKLLFGFDDEIVSYKMVEISGKKSRTRVQEPLPIDFSNYSIARRFIIRNTNSKGYRRPVNEQIAIMDGLEAHDGHELYAGVDYRRVLQERGINYRLSSEQVTNLTPEKINNIKKYNLRGRFRNEEEFRQLLPDALAFGFSGFKMEVHGQGFASEIFDDGMKEYDPGKWGYYGQAAAENIGGVGAVVEQFNTASVPVLELMSMVKEEEAVGELLNMAEAFQAIVNKIAYYDHDITYEHAMDLIVTMLESNVAHGKHPFRTFATKRELDHKSAGNLTGQSNIWQVIPIDANYARPELGFFPNRIHMRLGDSVVLIGCGGEIVLQSEERRGNMDAKDFYKLITDGKMTAEQAVQMPCPNFERNEGRPIDKYTFSKLVTSLLKDMDAGTRSNIDALYYFLMHAFKDRIAKKPIMSYAEGVLQRERIMAGN
jgi:hypothetical protein